MGFRRSTWWVAIGIDQFLGGKWMRDYNPSMIVVFILTVPFVSVLLWKGCRLRGAAGVLARSFWKSVTFYAKFLFRYRGSPGKRISQNLTSHLSSLLQKQLRADSKANLLEQSFHRHLSRQKRIFRTFISNDEQEWTKIFQNVFLNFPNFPVLVRNFWHENSNLPFWLES